jgi:hypothetical protein
VKQRFRNSVTDVQTLPGADTDSDHNLLAAKICTILRAYVAKSQNFKEQDVMI